MKRFKVIIFLLISGFVIFILISDRTSGEYREPAFQERSGTAIIMSGAAARIPQEAALLEELDRRGLLKDVVFISGVSSGALNAVMLNGIISGRMTWDEYKYILGSIRDSDIFIQEPGKKLPVNTEPARNLFKKVVEDRLGFYHIGDLPVTTEISFTSMKGIDFRKKVYRMCSRKINEESDTSLSLVDIMMASSAFPIVFPPVRIDNVKTIPDDEYIDGGVGDDHIPFYALLQFEKYRGKGVSKVFIVSRKSDSIPELSEELRNLGIDDRGRFDRLGISLDDILKKDMLRRLDAFARDAPDLILRSYVWIPDFPQNFLLFNFDNLKEQYDVTSAWARNHNPVPLDEFLSDNHILK